MSEECLESLECWEHEQETFVNILEQIRFVPKGNTVIGSPNLGVRITEHLADGKCLEVVLRVSEGCLRGV